MDILIRKKLSEFITPECINFNELIKNSNTTLSLNCQTKMSSILNEEFTIQEQKWYVTNLFMYMHYHPTFDFPINLEHVFFMIGFANKGNAKRTLENNFIKDEDYRIIIPIGVFETEAASPSGEAGISTKNLGGAGLNKEVILLNIDTFKSLCMLAKTVRKRD